MTTSENEISSAGSPKKHFFKVPAGIQNFTDEQIDAFAEHIYNQIIQSSHSDKDKEQNEKLAKDEGEK